MHQDAPLCECDYGACCVGGLQNGQVFYLHFLLEDKEVLRFSEKRGGIFPSETNKTLCLRRLTLTNLQKYYVTFRAVSHFFFFKRRLRQNNTSIGRKSNERIS